jgi:uncharacterized protein
MNCELNKLMSRAISYLKKADSDRLKHTLRVLKFAEEIAKTEKVNLKVIRFAAILHDIGKYKESKNRDHSLISVDLSKKILKNFNLDSNEVENILHCIKVHGLFKKKTAKTKEAEIIQDADKLDRLSTVRIANYFYYGGKKNRSFNEIIVHFRKEVVKTKEFNTKTGIKLAKLKREFALKFVDNFKLDWVEER